MSMYLARFTLTPATWARLLEKPEDRRQALEPVFAAVGGKLHGFWYAFGDADGYVLGEFPDDVVAASTLTKVAASGAFASVSTTKLDRPGDLGGSDPWKDAESCLHSGGTPMSCANAR
jgi:uncharacterized protein with GYD domain